MANQFFFSKAEAQKEWIFREWCSIVCLKVDCKKTYFLPLYIVLNFIHLSFYQCSDGNYFQYMRTFSGNTRAGNERFDILKWPLGHKRLFMNSLTVMMNLKKVQFLKPRVRQVIKKGNDIETGRSRVEESLHLYRF